MSDSMTQEQRVAAIQERLKAATPGPWNVTDGITDDEGDDHGRPFTIRAASKAAFAQWGLMGDYRGCHVADVTCNPSVTGHRDSARIEANAEFIANAPSDLAWLLAERDALSASREEVRARPTQAEVWRIPNLARDVARVGHWMLNDRGYTKAMAARDLLRAARTLYPELEDAVIGDAKPFEPDKAQLENSELRADLASCRSELAETQSFLKACDTRSLNEISELRSALAAAEARATWWEAECRDTLRAVTMLSVDDVQYVTTWSLRFRDQAGRSGPPGGASGVSGSPIDEKFAYQPEQPSVTISGAGSPSETGDIKQ